jgi:hypothetical protein
MHAYPTLMASGATIDLYDAPRTLGDVITKAPWVVRGKVTSAVFKSKPDLSEIATSNVTMAISETLKGSPRNEVVIKQIGGPTNAIGGIVILTWAGDQLLLPGDDVLLIGSPYGQASGDYTFYPVGKYAIRDNRVYASPGNPCNTLDGLAVSEVSRIISKYVESGVGDEHLSAHCDWSRWDGRATPTPTPAD